MRDRLLLLALAITAAMIGLSVGIFVQGRLNPNSSDLWSFAGGVVGAIVAGGTAIFIVAYSDWKRRSGFEGLVERLLDDGILAFDSYESQMVEDPNDPNEKSRLAVWEMIDAAKSARSTSSRLRIESVALARCAQSLSAIGDLIASATYQASPSANYYWHENSRDSVTLLRDAFIDAKKALGR